MVWKYSNRASRGTSFVAFTLDCNHVYPSGLANYKYRCIYRLCITRLIRRLVTLKFGYPHGSVAFTVRGILEMGAYYSKVGLLFFRRNT